MTDPLNISFEGRGVDTTLPVIQEGTYPYQCTASQIVPNKDKTGHNWHLEFSLTEPQQSADGRTVPVNSKVFMDLALQPKADSADPEAFKRQIFATQDALSGTTIDNRPVFNNDYVQSVVGKTVMAHVYPDEWPKGSGNFNTKVRRLKSA